MLCTRATSGEKRERSSFVAGRFPDVPLSARKAGTRFRGQRRLDRELHGPRFRRPAEHRRSVQLKGKRLGADRKGGSSIDATIVLRHFGVDPDDVTWVDSRGKPPDTERYRLSLFEKGELDAVCCDPPHWNIAVRMGGRRLTSARDLYALPEAGLSTTIDVIEEKPELVLAMVRATLRGAEFARLNRKETIDCILPSPGSRQPRAGRDRLGRGSQRLGSGTGHHCVRAQGRHLHARMEASRVPGREVLPFRLPQAGAARAEAAAIVGSGVR